MMTEQSRCTFLACHSCIWDLTKGKEREREGFTVKVREMPFSNVQDFKTGLPFLYTLESFYVGLDSEIATYLIRDTTIKLVLTE